MTTSRVLLALLFVTAVVFAISCSDHGKCQPPEDQRHYSSRVIRDYLYLDRTYFDLARRDTLAENDLLPGDSITHLELWYTTGVPGNHWTFDAKNCSLFVDLSQKNLYATETTAGSFMPFGWDTTMGSFSLEPTQHYVIFDRPFSNRGALGAYIRFKRQGEVQERIVGSLSTDTSYSTLKLVAAPDPQPSYVTWNYVWRNVYSLGGRIDDPDNLEVKIYKGSATNSIDRDISDPDNQHGASFIHLLGLDGDNNGRIDGRDPQIVDLSRGHLRFPSREPFADQILDVRVDTLYHTKSTRVRDDATRYYMIVRMPTD